MNLSFQQTDKISTGSLVTRLSNDVTQVQDVVKMAISGFVRNSVMFVGGIWMLYRQSPKFASACNFLLKENLASLCSGSEKTGQHQQYYAGDSRQLSGGQGVC